MAADKDAAKRRRQARNRQERINRQKRIEAARRSEAKRPAPSADAETSGGATKASTPAAKAKGGAAASGGRFGRLLGPRPAPTPPGPGGRPSRAQPGRSATVEDAAAADVGGARGALAVRMVQPGGRAALLALFVAVVSAVTLLAFPVVPLAAFEYYGETVVSASTADEAERAELVEAFEDADPVTAGTGRLLDVADPLFAIVFSVVPMVIAAIAVAALTKPTRSRTLLVSAMAAALFVFFSQGIGTFFLLGVFALGFAAYQSRKADTVAAAAARATAAED